MLQAVPTAPVTPAHWSKASGGLDVDPSGGRDWVSPLRTSKKMDLQLSKYWNIYWGLIRPKTGSGVFFKRTTAVSAHELNKIAT